MKKVWICALIVACIAGGYYFRNHVDSPFFDTSDQNIEAEGEEDVNLNEKKEKKSDASSKKKNKEKASLSKEQVLKNLHSYDAETELYHIITEEEILELAKQMSAEDIFQYLRNSSFMLYDVPDWLVLLNFDEPEKLEELRDLFVLYSSIKNSEYQNLNQQKQWETKRQEAKMKNLPFEEPEPQEIFSKYKTEDTKSDATYKYHHWEIDDLWGSFYIGNTQLDASISGDGFCYGGGRTPTFWCAKLTISYDWWRIQQEYGSRYFEKNPNFEVPQTLTFFGETYTLQQPEKYQDVWSERRHFMIKPSHDPYLFIKGYNSWKEVETAVTEQIQKNKSISSVYGIHFRQYPWILFFYEKKDLRLARTWKSLNFQNDEREETPYFSEPLFIENKDNLKLNDKNEIIDMDWTYEKLKDYHFYCVSGMEMKDFGKEYSLIVQAYDQQIINRNARDHQEGASSKICENMYSPSEKQPLFVAKPSSNSGEFYIYFSPKVWACPWSVQGRWCWF